jgi:hypothetical protein
MIGEHAAEGWMGLCVACGLAVPSAQLTGETLLAWMPLYQTLDWIVFGGRDAAMLQKFEMWRHNLWLFFLIFFCSSGM